jgi:TRAP-type uncharacterized transport system substrate-binding protein
MRIALVIGLCLVAVVAEAAARDKTKDSATAESVREAKVPRLNDAAVTIMAGAPRDTALSIAEDIAAVLDDGDRLRVIPMVGKGPAQSIQDVLYLRGVDMGITQANILKHLAKTDEFGPDLEGRIAYVAKLFNEEMHVLVRSDIADLESLKGRPVNFGVQGSGAEMTARLVFEALGIDVVERHLDEAQAIEQVKSGKIAATVVLTGKPAPVLAHLDDVNGLRLLGVRYAPGLEEEYYPATLTHEDYPKLIPEGASVDTLSVCAVLITFNWKGDNPRYKKLAKFVDGFFANFDSFLTAPRHPKWREVNFAATLEGWQRSPLAQEWVDKAVAGQPKSTAQSQFDTFLARKTSAAGAPISDAERASLFRDFLEWSKSNNSN